MGTLRYMAIELSVTSITFQEHGQRWRQCAKLAKNWFESVFSSV